MKDFLLLFCCQFVAYFIIAANQRAVAIGLYGWTAVTDMAIAAVNFFLIKKVAKSESRPALLGYIMGGACGSLLAIFCSLRVFGR